MVEVVEVQVRVSGNTVETPDAYLAGKERRRVSGS